MKKEVVTDETLQHSLVLEIEELKRLKAMLPSSMGADAAGEPHVQNRKRRKNTQSSDAQS